MNELHGPKAPAGWVIDRDYIETGDVGRAGLIAGAGGRKAIRATGIRFRLLDGDNEVYYGGSSLLI